jgi:hypothetical protein
MDGLYMLKFMTIKNNKEGWAEHFFVPFSFSEIARWKTVDVSYSIEEYKTFLKGTIT